jgi:riboflavin biosynthesis pyrimidine reductase
VDGLLAVTDVVRTLRQRGFSSIVCEGGPSLAGQLLLAHMVDEFCLSTVPTVIGSPASSLDFGSTGRPGVTLTQLLIDDTGVSYARWAVERSAQV